MAYMDILYGYVYMTFSLIADTVWQILWLFLYKEKNADNLGILNKTINSNNLIKQQK
jgi:hypothetical protein